jgi:hypothetical protein
MSLPPYRLTAVMLGLTIAAIATALTLALASDALVDTDQALEVEITWQQPDDVEGGLLQADSVQNARAASLFSWRQFIAINWPVKGNARGVPNRDWPISHHGMRVWESWKELDPEEESRFIAADCMIYDVGDGASPSGKLRKMGSSDCIS